MRQRVLDRNLGEGVDAERGRDRLELARGLRRAHHVPGPQPGHPVCLGKRAEDEEARKLADELEAGVDRLDVLEVDVGLVEQHVDVVRELRQQPAQ